MTEYNVIRFYFINVASLILDLQNHSINDDDDNEFFEMHNYIIDDAIFLDYITYIMILMYLWIDSNLHCMTLDRIEFIQYFFVNRFG